ncbi:hypothetical protein [Canibacter oris]|uniref:Terminase n=1 Tax=Canibacter oris TaxID=1365628 RepID=A0A840DIM7_9MICO|nr:hypothetical protein [Canibacter oris]MBB4071615.1 hypothetical protein [Canibacter oris]
MSHRSRSLNRSNLKLSETARHLCIPEGVSTTSWPMIEARCEEFGVLFDRWQQGIGTLAFSYRENGFYSCGIGGVWISIPRQTGKTYLFGWAVFALASLAPDLTIIWTAHHLRTSDETFNKMAAMAEKTAVRPHIKNIRRANGQQEIHFHNNSRIKFGSRAYGFGRGFDKVDIMVFDECQILTEAALADMLPATNAAPNGLPVFMGTPPRPKDPGEAFTSRRQEALESGDPDTLYVEFSADKDAKIIDWKQLELANPSYPHRTKRQAIERMRKNIGSDDNFRREAYGIWDELAIRKTVFTPDQWDNLKTSTPPPAGTTCYAVKVTPDGSTVALAAARRPADTSEPVFIEAIHEAPTGEGIGWVIEWLAARRDRAAQIVIDSNSMNGYLLDGLRRLGVRNKRQVTVPTVREVIAAHGMFLQAVVEGTLAHSGQELLTREVLSATTRKIGNNGGFGWQAPDGETVAAMEAATLAFHAARTTTRRPGRKQVVTT